MKPIHKRAAVIQKDCVACGYCVPLCPKMAIKIVCGMYAEINPELCIGCGKCARACPASVIEMQGVFG